MRKMTTQDIQQVSLDILKDVHGFCEQQGINYTLFGGTLIGAIRHEGFIPWDDDVDIAMPRPDYELFVRTYKSPAGYQLFSREKNGRNVYLSYARVCDMEQTYVDTEKYPWSAFKTGVWIDIFPLDGMPENEDAALAHTKTANKLFKKTCIARSIMGALNNKANSLYLIKMVVGKLLLPFYYKWNKLKKTCLKYDFNNSTHYSNLSFGGYGIKEYCNKNVLSRYVLHRFENTWFYIMQGYDEALRIKYGDYMTPPPIKEQKGGHNYDYYFV